MSTGPDLFGAAAADAGPTEATLPPLAVRMRPSTLEQVRGQGDVLRVGPYRFLVRYDLSDLAVQHLITYLTSSNVEESIDVELIDPEAADSSDDGPFQV